MERTKTLFMPGCALRRYKPELIARLERFLSGAGMADGVYAPCCKADDRPEAGCALIVCCPGCEAKFRAKCPDAQVISLWEALLETDFPFPDYGGARMTIHDACRARGRASARMGEAARRLCERMNITLVEPENRAHCCGGCAGDYEARRQMASRRAAELPEKDVAVYCTGCARSFAVTDAAPRHLLDLLFGEPTKGLYPPK